MPYGEYAKCPHFGKYAYGAEEIEEFFGYRYNGTRPQSWCKECRNSNEDEEDDMEKNSDEE